MIRVLRSQEDLPALRLWMGGEWPRGDGPADGISIEWVGQVGHPTSYALLGGSSAQRSEIKVSADGPVFDGSLAGRGDVVRFGLPMEYRDAVEHVLGRLAGEHPFEITEAAHGEYGSSVVAFRAAATFLLGIADRASELKDDELWVAWRSAFTAVAPPTGPLRTVEGEP